MHALSEFIREIGLPTTIRGLGIKRQKSLKKTHISAAILRAATKEWSLWKSWKSFRSAFE
ncbi:hypothetical protein B5F18_04215 [Lachnoclostridium sp. An181]|nr:hypothetical protein B5F18_04215 [Lachnoclostridium sp. An181]